MQNLTIEIGFDRFPPEHTCDGEDISPAIRVRGSDAPYLAVIVDDPDAPRGTFTHWLAWNVPATGEIPGGISPEPRVSHPVPAVQGTNDFQRIGYGGPCPPKGASHRFFIRVWGLEQELDLPPGAGRSRLEGALAAAATGYGEAMAIYERKKYPVSGPRPDTGLEAPGAPATFFITLRRKPPHDPWSCRTGRLPPFGGISRMEHLRRPRSLSRTEDPGTHP